MSLSLIAAMAQNGVIGDQGRLPWHLSEDLKRFKEITMGHTLLMGRKTFESLGKPLPGRQHVVLTRDPAFSVPGVRVVQDLNTFLTEASKVCEEIFVIGGGEVFRQTLPFVQKIYLTLIEQDFQGDTFLQMDLQDFCILTRGELMFSQKGAIPFRYVTAVRKNG